MSDRARAFEIERIIHERILDATRSQIPPLPDDLEDTPQFWSDDQAVSAMRRIQAIVELRDRDLSAYLGQIDELRRAMEVSRSLYDRRIDHVAGNLRAWWNQNRPSSRQSIALGGFVYKENARSVRTEITDEAKCRRSIKRLGKEISKQLLKMEVSIRKKSLKKFVEDHEDVHIDGVRFTKGPASYTLTHGAMSHTFREQEQTDVDAKG